MRKTRLVKVTVSSALVVILLLTACGPIAMVPGGLLYGETVRGPVTDWSFSNAYRTIQVETRPAFPHSVTVISWVHDGALYVPAMEPEGKQWTQHVLADPRVRLKIGEKIYVARAVYVGDQSDVESHRASVVLKYPEFAERDAEDLPPLWIFRIDPR